MKQYLLGLLANYLGLLLTMAIQVFLLPFLLAVMGPGRTGLYYLFISLANFAAIGIGWLTGQGMYLLAKADAKGKKEELAGIHHAVFLGHFAYGFVIFLVCCAAAALAGKIWLTDVPEELANEAGRATILLGLYIFFRYMHQADISLYRALLLQGKADFFRIVSQLFFVFFIFIFVLPHPGLDVLMLGNLLGLVAVSAWARIRLWITGMLKPAGMRLPEKKLVKEILLTRGGAFFGFGVVQYLLIYGDVLIIGAVLGPEKVTAFLLIWKIPEVIALILGRISEVLSPFITRIYSKKGNEETIAVFLCFTRIQFGFAVLSAFAYGYFGKAMVTLWVGTRHRPEEQLFYWIAAGALFFQVVNRHDVQLHFALAKLKKILILMSVEFVCKTAVMVVLFTPLGVISPLFVYVLIQAGGLRFLYRRQSLATLHISWKLFVREVIFPGLWYGISAFFVSWYIYPYWAEKGTGIFFLSFFLYIGFMMGMISLYEYIRHPKGLFGIFAGILNAA